jgi:hypothetical protein
MKRTETTEMCFITAIARYRMRDREGSDEDIREEMVITDTETIMKRTNENKWLQHM